MKSVERSKKPSKKAPSTGAAKPSHKKEAPAHDWTSPRSRLDLARSLARTMRADVETLAGYVHDVAPEPGPEWMPPSGKVCLTSALVGRNVEHWRELDRALGEVEEALEKTPGPGRPSRVRADATWCFDDIRADLETMLAIVHQITTRDTRDPEGLKAHALASETFARAILLVREVEEFGAAPSKALARMKVA